MASKFNPYLNPTGGRAKEALEFYHSVFGGEMSFMTFGQAGMEGPYADQVMHGDVVTEAGYTIMVADAPEEIAKVTPGNNVSLSISGDAGEADKLRGYFHALAEGGQVVEPLKVAPWGDEFGMLVDKFGFSWMVDIGVPQEE